MKASIIKGLIGGILATLIVLGISQSINSFNKLQIVERQKEIKVMINDIFAPQSMGQFDKSRKQYEGKLISTAVADKLYKKYSNTLSENDLQRSTEIGVYYSEINSFKKDCYIADVLLYNSGNLEKHIRYKFMFDSKSKVIDDYTLEILG
jgi:hypothetical protein